MTIYPLRIHSYLLAFDAPPNPGPATCVAFVNKGDDGYFFEALDEKGFSTLGGVSDREGAENQAWQIVCKALGAEGTADPPSDAEKDVIA